MNIRIVVSKMVLAEAFLLGVMASAQSVPEQFVVRGKAAEKIQDFNSINLATAERLVNACEIAAVKQAAELSIIVLDNTGDPVYMDRMDGQPNLGSTTAEMKARTALMGREPSKSVLNRAIQDPSDEFRDIQLGFFPSGGGLPVVVNNQRIGAMGAGGSAARVPVWSDEICVHKALVEVIGESVAPLIQDLPARKSPKTNSVPVPSFTAAAPPKSNLPAEFVVDGKAASNIFESNEISLAAAKKVARACRDWAASNGETMSLYILDSAGEVRHMERMDGQIYTDIRSALLKAQTAQKSRQPTSIRAAQLQNDPSGQVRSSIFYNFYAFSGGVPIVVDGQMIGAVGVAGIKSGADEKCAIEGLKAAFGDHVTLPVYPKEAGH